MTVHSQGKTARLIIRKTASSPETNIISSAISQFPWKEQKFHSKAYPCNISSSILEANDAPKQQYINILSLKYLYKNTTF